VNPVNTIDPFQCPGIQGRPMRCRIQYQQLPDRRHVVICSELPDNEGASVTNAAEQVATWLCHRRQLPPASIVWIEHYPPDPVPARGANNGRELSIRQRPTYDRCVFQIATGWGGRDWPPEAWHFAEPVWAPMTAQDFRELGIPTPAGVPAPGRSSTAAAR
jgi:hypothetical protein